MTNGIDDVRAMAMPCTAMLSWPSALKTCSPVATRPTTIVAIDAATTTDRFISIARPATTSVTTAHATIAQALGE